MNVIKQNLAKGLGPVLLLSAALALPAAATAQPSRYGYGTPYSGRYGGVHAASTASSPSGAGAARRSATTARARATSWPATRASCGRATTSSSADA